VDRFFGRRVAVTGEITDVLGPRTFVLDGDLLVMGRRDLNAQLEGGRTVDTTGVVREFDLRAFERALGADLSDTPFAEWDDRPVLIITAVTVR
jgi:hypothetical protein